MERRKFVKYTGLASLIAGIIPTSLSAYAPKSSSILVEFPQALTQIRHGALNVPFASGVPKAMPFDWILDVHQNIFLRDGFQRNLAQDMNVISIALEQEEGFEALQINKQFEKISLLWKSQFLDCTDNLPLRQIDLNDEKYTFYLGYLDKEEHLNFEQSSGVDYFVQVISGEIRNENILLNNESGLGLISDTSLEQVFTAGEQSHFLIIERQ